MIKIQAICNKSQINTINIHNRRQKSYPNLSIHKKKVHVKLKAKKIWKARVIARFVSKKLIDLINN